jgi:hypothetical protein
MNTVLLIRFEDGESIRRDIPEGGSVFWNNIEKAPISGIHVWTEKDERTP